MADSDKKTDCDIMEEYEKMRAQGKRVPPQAPHPGSSSGQTWEPDAETRARLGDALSIIKEIIEEP